MKTILRSLTAEDRPAHAEMLWASFNDWYGKRGWGKYYFSCPPAETGIFFDIYEDMTPGCSIAAFDEQSGNILGSCFYHPRDQHVSLGIMAVHPDFGQRGIGRRLVDHIVDLAESSDKSLRVISSAMNMDSFSLYNRARLVPRAFYHDMIVPVTAGAASLPSASGRDRVRDAGSRDVDAMAALDMAVSGIERKPDYAYAIRNPRGCLHASVLPSHDGAGIDGFMISVRHPALNMLGPCVARTEEDALALIAVELDRFKGLVPLLLVPVDARRMVDTLYSWGARNVELHLYQARGAFKPFAGINMPSFLPETG